MAHTAGPSDPSSDYKGVLGIYVLDKDSILAAPAADDVHAMKEALGIGSP